MTEHERSEGDRPEPTAAASPEDSRTEADSLGQTESQGPANPRSQADSERENDPLSQPEEEAAVSQASAPEAGNGKGSSGKVVGAVLFGAATVTLGAVAKRRADSRRVVARPRLVVREVRVPVPVPVLSRGQSGYDRATQGAFDTLSNVGRTLSGVYNR